MNHPVSFLALDLGAESGRVVLGRFDGERVQLSEAHRFASAPVRLPDGLHTDVLHIWQEIKKGIELASRQCEGVLRGIGIDAWGVDFALLDRQGALVSNPYHYRDCLTEGILDKAYQGVSRTEIFEQTGLQFMPINTLFQLLALRINRSPLLEVAETLLMMPDLFNYWLSGQPVNEFTVATTSQCYNPRQGKWAISLIEKFGLPTRLFKQIVPAGTVLGNLRPQVAEDTGITGSIPIIAPGCHDTALAVSAVPAQGKDFVYISSGTWSLLGAELTTPCISTQSLEANFTNEGGVCQTFRFLKNITGLWIVQECRRVWAHQSIELSYTELIQMASEAKPLRSLMDVDRSEFIKPGDMPERIRQYCRITGQPVPESRGAIVRCTLESLALAYRWVLEQLEAILGHRLEPIHIVGGGAQNRLLCQFTADATGRQVIAGPVEATATGSILMQSMALGYITSLDEARQIVRNSFETTVFEPEKSEAWESAYGKYQTLKAQPTGSKDNTV